MDGLCNFFCQFYPFAFSNPENIDAVPIVDGNLFNGHSVFARYIFGWSIRYADDRYQRLCKFISECKVTAKLRCLISVSFIPKKGSSE